MARWALSCNERIHYQNTNVINVARIMAIIYGRVYASLALYTACILANSPIAANSNGVFCRSGSCDCLMK